MFMQIYYRKDLTEEAEAQQGVTCFAFVQVDVWTTHLFVVSDTPTSGADAPAVDRWIAEMYEVENQDRGVIASTDDLLDTIDPGCAYDLHECSTLGEALACVTGDHGRILGAPRPVAAALAEHQQDRALESMSKYARKVSLRE